MLALGMRGAIAGAAGGVAGVAYRRNNPETPRERNLVLAKRADEYLETGEELANALKDGDRERLKELIPNLHRVARGVGLIDKTKHIVGIEPREGKTILNEAKTYKHYVFPAKRFTLFGKPEYVVSDTILSQEAIGTFFARVLENARQREKSQEGEFFKGGGEDEIVWGPELFAKYEKGFSAAVEGELPTRKESEPQFELRLKPHGKMARGGEHKG